MVAVVRDPAKVTLKGVAVQQLDILNPESSLKSVLEGVDAVIASIGGRAAGNHEMVAKPRSVYSMSCHKLALLVYCGLVVRVLWKWLRA